MPKNMGGTQKEYNKNRTIAEQKAAAISKSKVNPGWDNGGNMVMYFLMPLALALCAYSYYQMGKNPFAMAPAADPLMQQQL